MIGNSMFAGYKTPYFVKSSLQNEEFWWVFATFRRLFLVFEEKGIYLLRLKRANIVQKTKDVCCWRTEVWRVM